ncbi:MAG: hypothetical protein JXR19_01755 [Bacteroidia bacterium]
MSNPYNRYSIVVFFPKRNPLKWTYVYSIKSAAESLTNSFPTWKHMNVYDRKSGEFLKQFRPHHEIPKFIH